MNRPNLFSYATSELSQDAFICWLLCWAHDEFSVTDGEMHSCARQFLSAIFEKKSLTLPKKIKNLTVTKQDYGIDVLCVINKEYAVIIEDKTWTHDHSDQLKRYYDNIISRGFSKDKVVSIYYKSEDQSNYDRVNEYGYYQITRSEMIGILSSYQGDNGILLDYLRYLEHKEMAVMRFSYTPVVDWDYYCWVGFYKCLQENFDGDWDYVANPSGGFIGFWWHFNYGDDCDRYIQLEENKLCFKIAVNKNDDKRSLRNKWNFFIMQAAKELNVSIGVCKPLRFGSGMYMTVGISDRDYLITDSEGILNFKSTVSTLRDAELILNNAISYEEMQRNRDLINVFGDLSG